MIRFYKKYSEELDEDSTKFGEFVCSNYKWLPIDEQKKRAKTMENLTSK